MFIELLYSTIIFLLHPQVVLSSGNIQYMQMEKTVFKTGWGSVLYYFSAIKSKICGGLSGKGVGSSQMFSVFTC
jgi:hypothetical protein